MSRGSNFRNEFELAECDVRKRVGSRWHWFLPESGPNEPPTLALYQLERMLPFDSYILGLALRRRPKQLKQVALFNPLKEFSTPDRTPTQVVDIDKQVNSQSFVPLL